MPITYFESWRYRNRPLADKVSCDSLPALFYLARKLGKMLLKTLNCRISNTGRGALVQSLKLPAWKVGDRGFEFTLAFKLFQINKMFLSCSLIKIQCCGGHPWPRGSVLGLRPPELEICVWRAVSSHSSRHPQEVLLVQFNLYVRKCGLIYFFHLSRAQDWSMPCACWGNTW